MTTPLPSKSQINRAGQVLAATRRGEQPGPQMSVDDATSIVNAFRSAHDAPLANARTELRAVLAAAAVDATTSQRLKRQPRIVQKLARMRHSMLAR